MKSRSKADRKTQTREIAIAGNVRFDGHGKNGSARQQQKTVFNTGSGAYISGDVSTGGGDFIGRDNALSAHEAGISSAAFNQLLSECQALLASSGIDESIQEQIHDDLQQLQTQTQSTQRPDHRLLSTKLQAVSELVDSSTASLTPTGKTLQALLIQGTEWAEQVK